MDKSAPSTVVQGTLITSAVSAFVTGLYGIATKNAHYGFLAGAAALNSAVTAATFFGIREFGVSPILVSTLPWPQYSRRRRELGIDTSSDEDANPQTVSWSDLRKNKTLDSGISGLAAGGILRGWKSGPRAILPGALTAGAICTILQLAYNELGVTRLRYISQLNDQTAVEKVQRLSPSYEPQKPIFQRFLITLGLQEVSDAEYLEKMKFKRDTYLKRIEELERQVEADKSNTKEDNSS